MPNSALRWPASWHPVESLGKIIRQWDQRQGLVVFHALYAGPFPETLLFSGNVITRCLFHRAE